MSIKVNSVVLVHRLRHTTSHTLTNTADRYDDSAMLKYMQTHLK